MSLDFVIAILIIIVLYFTWWTSRSQRLRTSQTSQTSQTSPEHFIDDYSAATGVETVAPRYTSGASTRIADVSVSDLSGDWRTKFEDDEGNFYSRYFNRDIAARRKIENPTYLTATTF